MTSWQYTEFGNMFVAVSYKIVVLMSENKEMNEEVRNENEEQTNTNPETDNKEAGAGNLSTEQTPEEKYVELNDKFLRLYSEFDNYRKRTNKEKIELISTAGAGILKDLLPVLDDFERAIINNEQVNEPETLKEGFHLIYNKFKSTLETKGLKPMVTVGELFDSELHEAVANVPAPSDEMKGKIMDDVEKGYFLHDKVVRYAKVVVGQ